MQVYNNKLYRGIENRPFPILFYPIFVLFSVSPGFRQRYLLTFEDRNFKFGIEVGNDKLYCGITNGPSRICSFLCLFLFSFSPDFSSKISPQPFKIETSNLVYRFAMTSCNVGLKIDILLFVHPCIFLFLYIFVKDTSHMLWMC